MGTYAYLTFAEWQSQLAQKLNDITSTFYTPAELQFSLQDAMRFWNLATGDNRIVYPLTLDSSKVWYDLQTFSTSPRISSFTDFDAYTRIFYLLMEGVFAAPLTPLTSQFTSADISLAVQMKRDEFLLRTGCTRTIETIITTPSDPNITLPQTVIEAPRAYWISLDSSASTPLPKSDEFTSTAYQSTAPTNPSDPQTFSSGMESVLNVTLYPAPLNPGSVEFLTVESQPLLSPTATEPTILYLPSDFGPAIMWGAIGYLLSISTEAEDIPRAAVANARFEQFIDLIKSYPFTMTARNQNIPMYVDAVEVLDSYSPAWRITPAIPSVIGTAGQNLIAIPSSTPQIITLFMTANANIPINDGDEIQLGREVIDALTDYAQSILMFKCGGAEAIGAQELMKSILSLAAKRNNIIKSTSIYKENMIDVQARQRQIENVGVGNEDADFQD